MIIVNTIDNKSFGPFASSAGLFLFIGGLAIAYFSLVGLLLAIAGSFAAFTSTSTIIDSDNGRIKHADYLFGLLPAGKWVHTDPSMRLGVRKTSRGYRGYSRGTQAMDLKNIDFRIYLYGQDNKPIMPVKRFPTCDSAEAELKSLAALLKVRLK